jgi:sulfur relay (sulfurtransferase) DsrF/TusC family protein
MAKKILQVIESAYRATIEEQDDTIVWLSHAMKGAGADLDVLLRGNSVNYAIKGQDPSGLTIGDWKQAHPPELAEDIEKLIGKGVSVYLVEDDAAERGLERTDFIGGIKTIPRSGIAKLFGAYDQVWNW